MSSVTCVRSETYAVCSARPVRERKSRVVCVTRVARRMCIGIGARPAQAWEGSRVSNLDVHQILHLSLQIPHTSTSIQGGSGQACTTRPLDYVSQALAFRRLTYLCCFVLPRADTLMENLLDPCHVPFAHHGVMVSTAQYGTAATTCRTRRTAISVHPTTWARARAVRTAIAQQGNKSGAGHSVLRTWCCIFMHLPTT